jgi:hypothetical protein
MNWDNTNFKLVITGSLILSGSGGATGSFTGSFNGIHSGSYTGSLTGSLQGTASYALTASLLLGSVVSSSYATTSSYALVAQTLLGSVVSASYSATASTGDIFVVRNSLIATGSSYFTGSLLINSSSLDPTNPATILVNHISTSSFNAITIGSNVNNYVQLNLQNRSNSTTSSADIVATNDTGNENFNFIDMGINGSNYTNNLNNKIGTGSDAYVYSTGNNLFIGNTSSGKKFYIFSGIVPGGDGSGSAIIIDNSNISISGSLSVNNFIQGIQGQILALSRGNFLQ